MSLLDSELSAVGSRFRQLEWWRRVSVVCILLAIIGFAMLLMQVTAQWMHSGSGWYLLIAGLLCLLVTAGTTLCAYRDQRWIAHRIEEHFPELDQRLITTLDELERNAGKPLGYLQHTVFREAITHSYHNPWRDIVTPKLMRAFRSRGLVAFCLMFAAAIGLMKLQPPASAFVAKATRDIEDVVEVAADYEIKVEPGDVELEKGTNLIVIARFGKTVPKQAFLVAADGPNELRVPMSRSLDDPLFGGTISDVQSDLMYHVEYRSRKSDSFRVTTFTFPELVRADALLEYPSYTQMPERRIEDTRRVSVVEGTRVTWSMNVNKPGISAELVPENDGDAIPLQVDSTDPLRQLVSLDARETTTWNLVLTDADGRVNRSPPRITVKVTPNRPAQLKLELARDARVSPLEEFLVKATVSDDYGVQRFGLNYTLASAEPEDVILGEDADRRIKQPAVHQLDFEAMKAEPDQLLSYYFWAEDKDPDGKPRRTLSDMYFAEVRHFEEIFREGEQQPAGQQQQQQQQGQESQNAQDAEQLAELQKQIINATWNLIRREVDTEVTPEFDEDVSTIVQSQQSAAEQLRELSQEVQDSDSLQFVAEVQTYMLESLQQLMKAYSDSKAAPLASALAAERSAYQALLKLRAREHQIVQGQQQRGGQQSQSASRQRFQQQIQQLQLQNEQNRYETQRQAQQEQDQEQREVRQALNRLRELAQRQEDLNQQLKELQNALEQAESEEEREEIERQLKRLRDQQQEMLRDMDELTERLDEAPNQEALQETREQLQQTREQMQDAAESLEQGEVTPALASGTRAQRELEAMREELRRESANQFSEQMRDLRDRARELESRQADIGQQLQREVDDQEQGTGLRTADSEPEEKLGDALREQNEKLNELLQEIEDTVREAEETEPLLAESLYEAFRGIEGDQVRERLQRAAELTDRGLNDPARQLEGEARQGISDFRERVDEAAERILGDETDALRTAVRMLEDLERQLDEEIDQFSNSENESEREASNQPREPGGSDQREGERRQADASNDQRREGETREGDPSAQGERSDQERQSDQSGQGQQSGEQQDQAAQDMPGRPSQQDRQQGQESQPGGGSGQPADPQRDQPMRGGNQDQQGGRPSRPGALRDTLRDETRQDRGGGGGAWEQLEYAPITGDDFREWSDGLRDFEEIVDDPELRAEAARIRERARSFRAEFKRHSAEPKWDLIRDMVARPLSELRQEVSEELMRRSAAKNALVPIDRDPVPEQFIEQVRRYYENLGRGE